MTSTAHPVVVLIIEDDPYIRELLNDALSEQGYTVVAVARGDEALTVLNTLQPALITLDLNLPGVPGRLILQEIRQQAATSTLPVIVISAQHIPPEVQAQAQASIAKPFELSTFLAAVQQLVPLPAPAQSATNKLKHTAEAQNGNGQHH